MSIKPKVEFSDEKRPTTAETWAFRFKDRKVTGVSCLDDPGEIRQDADGDDIFSVPMPPPKMIDAINNVLRDYPGNDIGSDGDGQFIIDTNGGAMIRIRKGPVETCH